MPAARISLIATAVAALLSGCSVGPDYVAPKAAAPAVFGSIGPTTAPTTMTTDTEPPAQWWATLGDPELDSLVTRAVAGNLNLQRAGLRLVMSRSALRIAGAKELPTISNSDQFVRISTGSGFGLGSLTGGASSTSSAINSNIWVAGLDASWEIDVFGGQRRQIEAARADYQAGVEDRRDVMVSLTAEVARDYLNLRGLQERLRIARENLAKQRDTLVITQSLRKAGFNSQLDVSRAQTQVAQTEAGIIPLMTSVAQQEHAIATLLGLGPDDLVTELDPPAAVPTVPAMISIGMPADLIRRRPDLRRAERQIAAANARIGAAIADFYPKFSLTGDFGFDAAKFEHLFNWNNRLFLLDPGISWRLFDFGQTAAGVDREKARTADAVIVYHDAVLTALREVEDALAAYRNEQDHHAALARAVEAAQLSVDISTDQYKQGTIDFLQVLDTQRQLLAEQDDLAQSDQAIATDVVALYKALGGGWEAEAEKTRQAAPNADVPAAIPESSLLNGAEAEHNPR